jgi:hypothetical protein
VKCGLTVGNVESNTGGNVLFLELEPGIALGIAEYPMEEGILPVIVYLRGKRGQTRKKRAAI